MFRCTPCGSRDWYIVDWYIVDHPGTTSYANPGMRFDSPEPEMSRGWLWKIGLTTVTVLTAVMPMRADAFSLMGPFADWMQRTNGYRKSWDIGGPMPIEEEYRWNVPVVTYGFDATFLDFFGSNGVADVESAIAVLNTLPPAFQMDLGNYALATRRENSIASAHPAFNVRSRVLTSLLWEMGLGEPVRYAFSGRRWHPGFWTGNWEWDWAPEVIPDYIMQFNYDPQTLQISRAVNTEDYTAIVMGTPADWEPEEQAVDPLLSYITSVAQGGNWYGPGYYFIGLTRDDCGGLRYLLSSNNINYEVLLPDVRGVGSNSAAWTNGALRPGVEKVTFQRHPVQAGVWQELKYRYTDTFLDNGSVAQQEMERVVSEPDIVFSVGLRASVGSTSNWINCAKLAGDSLARGPGIIKPPGRIILYPVGPVIEGKDTYTGEPASFTDQAWGSFDGSPTNFVFYPEASTNGELHVRLRLDVPTQSLYQSETALFNLLIAPGERAALQKSTNLVNWVTVATVTNRGSAVIWAENWSVSRKQEFFRVRPGSP